MYSIENEFLVPSTTFSGSDGNSRTVPFGEIETGATPFSQSLIVFTFSAKICGEKQRAKMIEIQVIIFPPYLLLD